MALEILRDIPELISSLPTTDDYDPTRSAEKVQELNLLSILYHRQMMKRELLSHRTVKSLEQQTMTYCSSDPIPREHRAQQKLLHQNFRSILSSIHCSHGHMLRATKGGLASYECWSYCDGCGVGSQFRDDGHCDACFVYNRETGRYERVVSVAPRKVRENEIRRRRRSPYW